MREYTNLEGRDLWEYRLNLSAEEVTFLIDHLLELDGSFAPYYFADDNCSQQILELIEVAKPHLNLASQFHDITIPLDTVKALANKGMLSGEKVRLSLQTEWRTRYTDLHYSEKSALREIVRNPIFIKEQNSGFSFLTAKEQARTLEVSLSYLAIQEYREQKDRKEEKYTLSLARAKIGSQTEPLIIPTPLSPLLSSPSGLLFWIWKMGRSRILSC